MGSPEILWDVYNTPRIDPIQFGNFIAAEAGGRETIIQNCKYASRGPRARAWYARQEITKYLVSPLRKLGDIDAAKDVAHADSVNPSFSSAKQNDALASKECLSTIEGILNKLELTGKDLIALPEEQFPTIFGPLKIQVDLACLIRSVDKDGEDRIGGLLLNTQKGSGLGQRPETIAKRSRAGEAVAIMVLKRVMDEFSDMGIPLQEDCLHVYVRGEHFWPAPKAYTQKLKHMEADARAVAALWDVIPPPTSFDPDKAAYHD